MIMLHGIWYKLEDWIKRYLIQTYHRLSQKYSKSYRLTFRVTLWLVFKQLSSFLFVYWLLFVFPAENITWNFSPNWRIESRDILLKLGTGYFRVCCKSYRIAFRVALWLDFEQLSSYLFVYRRLFLVTISKRYMEFDTNWRIESRDILFKHTTGYLKSISSNIE